MGGVCTYLRTYLRTHVPATAVALGHTVSRAVQEGESARSGDDNRQPTTAGSLCKQSTS